MTSTQRFRPLWPVGPLPHGLTLPWVGIWRNCNERLRWGCCIDPFDDVSSRWLSGNRSEIPSVLNLPWLSLIIIQLLRARHARRSLPFLLIVFTVALIILSKLDRDAVVCGKPLLYRVLFPDKCRFVRIAGYILGFPSILSEHVGASHQLPIRYEMRFLVHPEKRRFCPIREKSWTAQCGLDYQPMPWFPWLLLHNFDSYLYWIIIIPADSWGWPPMGNL